MPLTDSLRVSVRERERDGNAPLTECAEKTQAHAREADSRIELWPVRSRERETFFINLICRTLSHDESLESYKHDPSIDIDKFERDCADQF